MITVSGRLILTAVNSSSYGWLTKSQFQQHLMWHLPSAYMKCVYGWAYATSWPNFLGWIVYQIFLPMLLSWRTLRARDSSAKINNYNMVIRYSLLRHNKYRTYKFLPSKLLFALKTVKSAVKCTLCYVKCPDIFRNFILVWIVWCINLLAFDHKSDRLCTVLVLYW